jgi:uncharacterized protein (DUF488 family)
VRTEPFFTIGHSTRSLDELAALLGPNGVTRVVDVRTVPRSRANPQYDKATLPRTLAKRGLAYEHLAALGGLRGRTPDTPPELNGFWQNASFHRYADYALTEGFREGLAELLERGRAERVVVMCAEAVWWRCHRRIIADHLLAAGADVFHLVSSDVPEPASLTPSARPGPGGTIVYPAPRLRRARSRSGSSASR